MKARIDKNKCIGCSVCANICPEGIELVVGKASIKNENAECLKDAANSCPIGSIIIKDGEDKETETSLNQGDEQGFGRVVRMGADRGLEELWL